MYRNYITQILSFHDNVDIFKMSRSPLNCWNDSPPPWANWLINPLYTPSYPLIMYRSAQGLGERRNGLSSSIVHLYTLWKDIYIFSPSHTLRCYTLTTECTEAPAMYDTSMRCPAMHVGIFAPDGGISQVITVRFSKGLQYNDGHFTRFHLIYDPVSFSVKYFLLPS